MEKSRKRAERRWRSWCTWMRRLKGDQATHSGPWSPKYSYEDGSCKLVSFGDRTSLCACFDLTSRQATRFKDTPNGCNCQSCANPRRSYDGRSSSALTFAEQRAFLDDREDWSRRKRREGIRFCKVNCIGCGRQIGKVWVKTGQSLYGKVRSMGWDRRCTSCRKRLHDRLEAEKSAK